MQNVNGQKSGVIPRSNNVIKESSNIQVSQHDDLIQFMVDSWKKVFFDPQTSGQERLNVSYYCEGEVNSQLKDFIPVDLEALKNRHSLHHNLSQHA